jgi:hypothetical protein
MTPQYGLAFAATALLAGGAGWMLHGRQSSVVPTRAAVAPPPHAADDSMEQSAAAGEPVILVASDGTVTLHVEREPLDWVLGQIALQSGRQDLREPAQADPAFSPLAESAQTEKLIERIQHGSADERSEGLMQARSQGVPVPDEILKSLYEGDESASVSMLAFEAYLERRDGDIGATRDALRAAISLSNDAIRREAQRRLDELDESQRIALVSPQGAAP